MGLDDAVQREFHSPIPPGSFAADQSPAPRSPQTAGAIARRPSSARARPTPLRPTCAGRRRRRRRRGRRILRRRLSRRPRIRTCTRLACTRPTRGTSVASAKARLAAPDRRPAGWPSVGPGGATEKARPQARRCSVRRARQRGRAPTWATSCSRRLCGGAASSRRPARHLAPSSLRACRRASSPRRAAP